MSFFELSPNSCIKKNPGRAAAGQGVYEYDWLIHVFNIPIL